jgi:hypothetical protein
VLRGIATAVGAVVAVVIIRSALNGGELRFIVPAVLAWTFLVAFVVLDYPQ